MISNYYYPYVSGMTEYTKKLAELLSAERGIEVTVLASQHDRTLKREEVVNGVRVVRSRVLGKISKGVISPQFIRDALRLSKEADVVHLHLPMIESGLLCCIINRKKLVITYHCDIYLKNSILNKAIMKVMDWSSILSFKRASAILVITDDYARHSRVLKRYIEKCYEVVPPVKEYCYSNPSYRENEDMHYVGFCGRIVEEKGIDYLIKSVPYVLEQIPNTVFLIGGDYKNIVGGSIYSELLKIMDEGYKDRIRFLGKIPEEKMQAFYSSLDVFTLPSINSQEAFGLVQVEALQCGVPVVASDLPGVRQVVLRTGMGRICKIKDERSLADCIVDVIKNKNSFENAREKALELYNKEKTVESHLRVYQKATI